MEEVVVMLEKQVTNWGMKITVLLYKFQLCLLADNDSIGSGVAILEVVARHPDWWKTCQVLEVVWGLDWTEGYMMGGSVKLVWNSWVVLKKDTGCSMETGCGEALVWLHNLATQVIDHITCKLGQGGDR